jgi:hypothetical protein
MIVLREQKCCTEKVPYGKLSTIERVTGDYGLGFYICPFCAKFHVTTKGKEELLYGKFATLYWNNGDTTVCIIPA